MLSKTPKESAKKTKSARNARIIIGGLIGVVVAITLTTVVTKKDIPAQTGADCSQGLSLQGTCIALEHAVTNQARIKGLSDRDSLAQQTGMLFVFERVDEQCFWMKDMRFSIDMIWLSDRKQVLKIERNVSPNTYPNSFCAPDTKYVLELPANDTQKYAIGTGQILNFR